MTVPGRITARLAGLTEDQEELLEEILESHYFRERTRVCCGGSCGARPGSFSGCGRCWTR